MRKKISTLLMISSVILSALLIPTVLAKKPTDVTGTWAWTASDWSVREAGGNIHYSATEHDTFTGTFIGFGEGPFTMTFHPDGFYTGSGRTTFTGEVLGEEGTLVIMWVGMTKWNDAEDAWWWWFKWVILSGTGELENLRGQGTCWGPGPAGVVMTGKIHFDPS